MRIIKVRRCIECPFRTMTNQHYNGHFCHHPGNPESYYHQPNLYQLDVHSGVKWKENADPTCYWASTYEGAFPIWCKLIDIGE